MQHTHFLSALELVVVMAAVILQHQNATVIRAGEERLAQPLCALQLALYMDSVIRKGNDVCVSQAFWGTAVSLVSVMIMEQDSGGV